jgi:serine/threonine-protein kinase
MRKRIGKYEVTAEVGRSEIGRILRGRDRFIEREVTILTCDEPASLFRDRFVRRAEAIAGGLFHENIAAVIDLGLDDGVPFFVEDRVAGSDLLDLLSGRPKLDLAEALDLVRQVCRGIAHAHRQGFVHGRLGLDRVRLDLEGKVKVTGFAESTFVGPENGTALPSFARAFYLAPEQVRRDPTDGRADIWSIGVCLAILVKGRPPFSGGSIPELCEAIVSGEPDLPTLERSPELTVRLEGILRRCFQKEPSRRFSSASELEQALAALAEARRNSDPAPEADFPAAADEPDTAAADGSQTKRTIRRFKVPAQIMGHRKPKAARREVEHLPIEPRGEGGFSAFEEEGAPESCEDRGGAADCLEAEPPMTLSAALEGCLPDGEGICLDEKADESRALPTEERRTSDASEPDDQETKSGVDARERGTPFSWPGIGMAEEHSPDSPLKAVPEDGLGPGTKKMGKGRPDFAGDGSAESTEAETEDSLQLKTVPGQEMAIAEIEELLKRRFRHGAELVISRFQAEFPSAVLPAKIFADLEVLDRERRARALAVEAEQAIGDPLLAARLAEEAIALDPQNLEARRTLEETGFLEKLGARASRAIADAPPSQRRAARNRVLRKKG